MISGKDKGKTGKVIRVDRSAARSTSRGSTWSSATSAQPARPNAPVGVIEREGGIHVSNVAILDPKDKKPTRIRMTRTEQGARMRVTKRSGTNWTE